MDYLVNGFWAAFALLANMDDATFSAITATLVSTSYAMAASLLMGLPMGFALGYCDFPGKKFLCLISDTLLAFPTVLIGLLGARMVPGIELLLSYSTLEKEIADCDLVITGEGQSDAQTLMGKVPAGIAARAAAANCPIICVSGALGIGYEKLYELGFIGVYSIADRAMSFLQALEQAPAKLQAFIYSLIRTIVSLQRDFRSSGFTQ